MSVDSLALSSLYLKTFARDFRHRAGREKFAADLFFPVFTSNGRSAVHSAMSDSSSFIASKSKSTHTGRVGSELLIKSVPT